MVFHHRFRHSPLLRRNVLHLFLVRLHRLVHPAFHSKKIAPGDFHIGPFVLVDHPVQFPVPAKDENLALATPFRLRAHPVPAQMDRRRRLPGPGSGIMLVHDPEAGLEGRGKHPHRENYARQNEIRPHRTPPSLFRFRVGFRISRRRFRQGRARPKKFRISCGGSPSAAGRPLNSCAGRVRYAGDTDYPSGAAPARSRTG